VGAGLAGLSTALYLSQIDPDRHITIVDKQEHDIEMKKKTTISSFAAAGMLAPQSERLPKGSLLDLCLASRRMYPDFCDLVESLAKESGEEGAKYLAKKDRDETANLDPWSVGYMASGGFLAPAFAGDSVATWAPPDDGGSATWLDEIQVRELEPQLHPDVVGGWWFSEDSSVDARRLTCSLYAACMAAGVQLSCGNGYEVSSLDLADGKCHGLWLQNGKYFKAKTVLVANGAWMRNLLPVPIEPHKGQSLSLKMPSNRPPILRRVLFAQDSYIVPKADGHIVIGATVEAGSFDGAVTPAGLLHILTHALQLVPGLKDLPVVETWAGLRPTTPDKGPIIGKSPWENLFLAGGYWRNGVLLAPKTAQLLACLMTETKLSPADDKLLKDFSWDRFTKTGGGATMAANARYAASMHPIHSRVSGAGVAAAVGTELGSYSTATSAKEERKKDRNALWESNSDDAFERAAQLGKRDASSFSMGEDEEEAKPTTTSELATESPVFFPETKGTTESSTDANKEASSKNDMALVYESIKENKAKQEMSVPDEDEADDRPDPGFRVYYVDPKSGDKVEVPPFTAPGIFLQSLRKDLVSTTIAQSDAPGPIKRSRKSDAASSYSEKTYDGYQDIQEENGGNSRADQLEAMRKARMKNRLDQEPIDETKIGSAPNAESSNDASNTQPVEESTGPDVALAYKKIKDNKSKQKMSLPEGDSEDTRPDPGFRVYHVTETGEEHEIPPFTPPGEFIQSLAEAKKNEEKEKKEENSAIKPEDINSLKGKESSLENIVLNGDDSASNGSEEYNEKTYDGYQTILEANSSQSREDELNAMRKARQSNRLGQPGIDESKLD